ncbi:hypothetical protein HU200_021215 [Digitaria exilis]|uniref:Uncharacterized protein n=1 Tax=Digitaria exilis TaxID=1010633 RepID=A0A835KFM3_9POAL|nr:hypothetical protein HU200_021215 [Digitaria exilis]
MLRCLHYRCDYFTPNGVCFCCSGTPRKEYCFLTHDECFKTCGACKPPKCGPHLSSPIQRAMNLKITLETGISLVLHVAGCFPPIDRCGR